MKLDFLQSAASALNFGTVHTRMMLFFLIAGSALAGPTVKWSGIPLSFEPNSGQAAAEVSYLARGSAGTLYLVKDQAIVARRHHAPLRAKPVGGNPSPRIVAEDRQQSISNYFIGSDPGKWRTGLPNYGRVRYSGVYPGIDLVYYGHDGRLEYDWIVSPGADPKTIRVLFDGAGGLRINSNGDLLIKLKKDGGPHHGDQNSDELMHKKPVVYQEIDGKRVEIAGAWTLEANKAGFRIGRYDRSRPLIIDPTMIYATYFGGNGLDFALGVAVDGSGNTYVTGGVGSANFPLAAPYQSAINGVEDVFVTKINSTGSARIYSTYLGSGGPDEGKAIAVDAGGNAYITGKAGFSDFPTQSAIQPVWGQSGDAFITKLNSLGSGLIYSTFLGGNAIDEGRAIAVDSQGYAYVAGITFSSNFPTVSPFQSTLGGLQDAFVAKVNPAGSAFSYVTYLGGNNVDEAYGIATISGDAYVTGKTQSTNFPMQSAFQGALGGTVDAFVTKLNSAGSALVYSTYLGGSTGNSTQDYGTGIAVDSSGNAYVTGVAGSNNFPTQSPIQGFAGGDDVFVSKFNAAGSALLYSTYIGGGSNEESFGIAIDSSGNAWVTGRTNSSDFPLTNPLQVTRTAFDIFVTEINASGTAKLFSTFLGGSGSESGNAIAVDVVGNAHIAGDTTSTDFPVANAHQASNGGGATPQDAVIILIGDNPAQQITPTLVNPASGSGMNQTFSFVFEESQGWQSLGIANILINNAVDGRNACYLAYIRNANTLVLVNDGGSAGGPYAGSMLMNGAGTISNSQCTINGAGSSAIGSGTQLTLTLNITFTAGFSGNKIVQMAARDTTGNSGWQPMGVWNIPGVATNGPGVTGISPGRTAASTQQYAFGFTDTNGYGDITIANVLLNSALDGRRACYIAFVPSGPNSGTVYLVNDAGSAGGPYAVLSIPSNGSASNSQCTINGSGSLVTGSGNTLGLTLNMGFSGAFSGNRIFYLAARSNTQNSGWQAVGTNGVP